jgi:putative hemolysin
MWGVAIVGDGFDTMGGFVYQRLGKIPSSGDTVEYDGLKIEVVSTSGRRPKKLRVTRSRYSVPPS